MIATVSITSLQFYFKFEWFLSKCVPIGESFYKIKIKMVISSTKINMQVKLQGKIIP